MQSIFRLPWCSDPIAPKMHDAAQLEKMRPTPVVEIPVWNKFKRKRTDSFEDFSSLHLQPNKKERSEGTSTPVMTSEPAPLHKAKTEQTSLQSSTETDSLMERSYMKSPRARHAYAHAQNGSENPDVAAQQRKQIDPAMDSNDTPMVDAPVSTSAEDMTRLQQIIDNEFNMQILMKHNELRLIEQELAKCQVALEQLRRVEMRPYPGADQLSESVSAGTGPAVLPPAGFTKPSHAAPFGVTDGPYSRHYSQWLLRDPVFDSVPAQASFFSEGIAHAAGRPTRNSGSARKSSSKSFAFPARPSDPLHSIPNYPSPAAAKDKSAPLVLKRSTDNQFVKLICNNCLRGNFSSIQGFLNHCRIAHKVDYKSHDAAAIDCGRPLEEHEVANLPAEPVNTPLHKPSLSRISTAASTPRRSLNLVHPLNTSESPAISGRVGQSPLAAPRTAVPSLASRVPSSADSSLTASPSVPRLSALFAKNKVGGDLAAAVAGARQSIDLGPYDEVQSPDDSELNSPSDSVMHARTVSGNGRASMMTMPGARSVGSKGIRQNNRQPKPSPLAPIPDENNERQDFSEIPESPAHQSLNLSPHTADSNPGLVSDREDDDNASASEDEAPQSEIARPFNVGGRNCSDNVEVEMVEDEATIDRSGVIIRRNSVFDEQRPLRPAATPSRKMGLNKRAT